MLNVCAIGAPHKKIRVLSLNLLFSQSVTFGTEYSNATNLLRVAALLTKFCCGIFSTLPQKYVSPHQQC